MLIFGNHFIPSIYSTITPMFEEAGFEVVVASYVNKTLKAKNDPLTVNVDLLLKNVVVKDYAAIVFLCDNDITTGSGRDETNRISQEAVEKGVVLAAICSGPRVLAHAGVVDGKTVTGEPSATCRLLEQKGGNCTGKSVEQDGLLITAEDRHGSKTFARTILETIADLNQSP